MDFDTLNENATSLINGFLMQDFKKTSGMKGYDKIKQHPFFKSVVRGLFHIHHAHIYALILLIVFVEGTGR